MVQITVIIPKSMQTVIDTLLDAEEFTSRADFIRTCVRFWMDEHRHVDTDPNTPITAITVNDKTYELTEATQ